MQWSYDSLNFQKIHYLFQYHIQLHDLTLQRSSDDAFHSFLKQQMLSYLIHSMIILLHPNSLFFTHDKLFIPISWAAISDHLGVLILIKIRKKKKEIMKTKRIKEFQNFSQLFDSLISLRKGFEGKQYTYFS